MGICREIRGWQPSLDLYETEDDFVLEADLPGVKPEGSRSVKSGLFTGPSMSWSARQVIL